MIRTMIRILIAPCQRLLQLVLKATVCAIALTFLATTPVLFATAPVIAAGLSPQPQTEQPATLIGPKANAPIPIYLRPAANQPSVGYGTNGAGVSITEQAGDFFLDGNTDTMWNRIRLNAPPFTEGWVQGKFLLLAEDASKEA